MPLAGLFWFNAVALTDKRARHALLAITSPFGDPATAFNAQKAQSGTVRGLLRAWHARQELTQVRICSNAACSANGDVIASKCYICFRVQRRSGQQSAPRVQRTNIAWSTPQYALPARLAR